MSEEKSKLGNIFAYPVESLPVESGQDFLSEVKIDPEYYNRIQDETDAVYSTYHGGITQLSIVDQASGLETEPDPVAGNVLQITQGVSRMGQWLEYERNQRAA